MERCANLALVQAGVDVAPLIPAKFESALIWGRSNRFFPETTLHQLDLL